MRGSDNGCEVYQGLEERAKAGGPLTPSEEELRVAHRRDCPLCAFERQVAALAGDIDDAGPASPMSAAEVDRFYKSVQRELAADKVVPLRERTRPGVFSFTLRRLALAAAFLSVTAALAVSLYVVRNGSAGGGRLFVVSGTTTAGDTVLRGGDTLREGEALTIDKGYAGFVPCYDVEVFADESSRIKMGRLSKTSCELSLEYGRVVTRAIAIPQGSRLVVATQNGTVEVKGTVFTVETDGVETKVRVMEGAVLVRNTKGLEKRVSSSIKMNMNSGETARITQGEIARDQGLLSWYDPGVNRGLKGYTPVSIHSVPDGAEILLAQKPIGRTPLSALVPPGRYNVEIAAAGFEPVGEVLPVEPNSPLSRKYLLKRRPAEAVQAPDEATGVQAVEPAPEARAANIVVERRPSAARRHEPARPKQVATLSTADKSGISKPDLLEAARILKEQRDFRGAAGTYSEVIAKFPSSPEAKVAVVHLGFIYLDKLREYHKALELFEKYLGEAENGILREEASWGRIKAYKALDQEVKEAEALKEFVARYGSSLYLNEAKRRLGELEQGKERR